MKRIFFTTLIVLLCLFITSCSSYRHKKLLKSADNDAKYEAAVKAYNDKNYYHATQLFENLLLFYRGRDKAESVNLYYAKSLLGSKDYTSAGYQFENFVRWFPYSKDAEEALFQSAYCKYLESPKYSLDQTTTKESLAQFQMYLNKYPQSTRVDTVNALMDKLRSKLIDKDYEIAYNYYKTENYQSAQFALRNFLVEYPDAKYREDAMYYIIISGYRYAENSIAEKREERFKDVVKDYQKFEALYPESPKLKELKKINDYCLKNINN
ncbi:MAG: outer membrane protein assembly factor BamD [Bacteroidales bacterium]|jgi:outer membrane protein assembly factor BamD|nr:outer membrane protein assembly factor BamD [Bacteroidales bacterium]